MRIGYKKDPLNNGEVRVRFYFPRKTVVACFYCPNQHNGKRCKNHDKKMRFLAKKAVELEKNIFNLQNMLSIVGRVIEKNNAPEDVPVAQGGRMR